MDYKRSLGFASAESSEESERGRRRLLRYINLSLLAHGLPAALDERDSDFAEIASGLLDNFQAKERLLVDHRCPVDRRIEAFLADHVGDVVGGAPLRLPGRSITLDRHGMARELALPADGHHFRSELVDSYRVANGVLHNPAKDRRTTVGTFHVVEDGLPVAFDKRAVPRAVFAALFRKAVDPPRELLELPFTSECEEKAHSWVSLLLRPKVCPAVPGVTPEKTMEVRFFAPGSLVSNLDFVESIFGNAGDPVLPENDAGLDPEHWTGHTGCVILATHLVRLTKKEVGLPRWAEATDRQRRDGMCWKEEGELYNDGGAFKVTCRTEAGVVVTIISDNYFGYCKKEVKTQISYSANLYGGAEEEHAGGALAFASYSVGDEFQVNALRHNGRTFEQIAKDYPTVIERMPEGYGRDRNHPQVVYVPAVAKASLREQRILWEKDGRECSIPLLPHEVYIAPSGYKLRMEKHPAAPSWRLIGTVAEGVSCHKPCTVSGGGKSEISKSLRDYMIYGPIFVNDIEQDLDRVEEIFTKDYAVRWREDSAERAVYQSRPSRPILGDARSLGSVIKLLTPSAEYNDAFNSWLRSIPSHVYALVFAIKRFYSPEWGDDWRSYFSVDIINGSAGHELKFQERKLVGTYLRVGLLGQQTWRTFKVRQDFAAAAKVQTEDDITASVVVAGKLLPQGFGVDAERSYKFAENCEYRLFQRPDDAVHRGLDKQAEADLAEPNNFVSNFEPLDLARVRQLTERAIDLDAFTAPMQELLRQSVEKGTPYTVCSAIPRMVDGKPTKNPRYLQARPDMVRPLDKYVAEMGLRLHRGIPEDKPLAIPVSAVLFGRRNNPPDPALGIKQLAVYGPIHYQEPPELFMDFIASLTGKSPSTTGFGSEGALTKGPFNNLRFAADLNAALLSYVLTGLSGFSTAAGHIGPNVAVGHDVSLLIPEIWCRLEPFEREPEFLRRENLLEPVEDFEHEGRLIPASRLGWRINYRFVRRFFGRVFDNPDKVFDDAILKPESQDRAAFAEGVEYIANAHKTVAQQYFQDGTAEALCPPLQALATIMAEGSWNGKTEKDAEVRGLFEREAILASDWYRERLTLKQQRDVALWRRHVEALEAYARDSGDPSGIGVAERLDLARRELGRVSVGSYLESLKGSLGVQPTP
ncbi:MAG: hypothetical protein GC160_07800 [Acidobacteria bacterium]|nr:hypothetical protein [Acidobacteriota bacterium]